MPTTPDGVRSKHVLPISDHLIRFAILVVIPKNSSERVARVLIDHVISVSVRRERYIQVEVWDSKTK